MEEFHMKKFISMFLAVAMCMSLCVNFAFASNLEKIDTLMAGIPMALMCARIDNTKNGR